MVTECGINATVTLDQWSDVFADLYARIARRFTRTEVRERVRRCLIGLLGKVERKNGWQLAEAIGDGAKGDNPGGSGATRTPRR